MLRLATRSENMTSIKKSNGGCYCKAVRYEVQGDPAISMICHCESCRRIAGAPVVAWLTFRHDCYRIVSGDIKEFESSPGVVRAFCASCSTPISYRSQKTANEIDIATCTLDDPNAYPPTHHAWLSDDLQWVQFGDHLPTYLQSPSNS
jgi:hypothetical protein